MNQDNAEIPTGLNPAQKEMPGVNKITGAENEQRTQVEPWKYFKQTIIQKRAQEIDNDVTHPWQGIGDTGSLMEDHFGSIVSGEAWSTHAKKRGLLIAEKSHDGNSTSVYTTDLDYNQRLAVRSEIRQVSLHLPEDIRHVFIRNLIDEIPNLQNSEVIDRDLARVALNTLPDYPSLDDDFTVPNWTGANDQQPSDTQRAELEEFMQLVARKMPRDKFTTLITEYQENLWGINDAYGITYGSIFTDMQRLVLENREDTKEFKDLTTGDPPEEYTIRDKVTRQISSEAELAEVLEALPFEPTPDTSDIEYDNSVAEIVNVNDIVGGSGAVSSWALHEVDGRGLPTVFRFAKEYQSGEKNLCGPKGEIIKLVEINGKYYISGDGTHRTAALKGLGVEGVPAIVTHAHEKVAG